MVIDVQRIPRESTTRSYCRICIIIFLLAFCARAYMLTLVPERYIQPESRWEMGAVAISLVETGQFGDPYCLPTGPTSHLPPMYPFILSLIYRVLGLTLAAGYTDWMIRITAGAIVLGMLPFVGDRFGLGSRAGIIGGFANVFIFEWPGHGEALTALFMILLLLAHQSRWKQKKSGFAASLFLGITWGLAFHIQPALLTVFIGCLIYELWIRQKQRSRLPAVVIILGIVLACSPWTWRNYTTFDTLLFIRGNFGLELRMGNHPGAVASIEVMDVINEGAHPRVHESEARKVQEWGEAEYMRRAGQEGFLWIRTHPGEFARLCMSRVAHVWFGPLHRPAMAGLFTLMTLLAVLGLVCKLTSLDMHQRAVILIPLITYPCVYYFVPFMIRYRMPLNWLFFLLAGAAVDHLFWRSKVPQS